MSKGREHYNVEAVEIETQEPMLRWFRYSHLPAQLQAISEEFAQVACWLAVESKRTPERTVALRKLLEAKDAAVRNALD